MGATDNNLKKKKKDLFLKQKCLSDQMEYISVFRAGDEVVFINGFRLFAGSQVNMKNGE